jgi:glycerol uptake facilitator-like aquaporin
MIQYVVEFFGTFFFLSVIVATGQPFLIAAALLAVLLLGASTSGAHFNPAVSVMFWMKGDLGWKDLLAYVGSQVAGGLTALYIFRAFLEPMRNTNIAANSASSTSGFMSSFMSNTNAAVPNVGVPSLTTQPMNTVKSVSPALHNTNMWSNNVPSNNRTMPPPMGGFRYRV